MINLKNFQLYDSQLIGGSPVLFLKDENGLDWYESQKNFSEETIKFVYNSDGEVVSINYDVSKLWPIGNSVAEIASSDIPSETDINGGWVFDGEKILARVYTTDELIQQAIIKRDSFMTEATFEIAPLQDAVDIGEATDAEITMLNGWKKYRVTLSRLDLSAAPDITWPEKPKYQS